MAGLSMGVALLWAQPQTRPRESARAQAVAGHVVYTHVRETKEW